MRGGGSQLYFLFALFSRRIRRRRRFNTNWRKPSRPKSAKDKSFRPSITTTPTSCWWMMGRSENRQERSSSARIWKSSSPPKVTRIRLGEKVCLMARSHFQLSTSLYLLIHHYVNSLHLPLQYGTADAEIKDPSFENTELRGSPFNAQSRSEYSYACFTYSLGSLPL